MLTLYVVRHGQTEHNLQGIIQGYLDTDLNETGRAQAELIAQKLQHVTFDMAFSSDLSRAKDTGIAILNRQRGKKIELKTDSALRERDMGELSGTRGPVPRPMPKSVESSGHFIKRCLTWFEQTIIPLAQSGDDITVLATSHGAYIITLFRTLVSSHAHGGLEYDIAESVTAMNHCGNTAIAIVTVDEKGRGRVESFNDQAHLSATPDELHIADAAPYDHR